MTMMEDTVFDATKYLNKSTTYEDTYSQYMSLFRDVFLEVNRNVFLERKKGTQVIVVGAPWSWVPLLKYLDARIEKCITYFPHCAIVEAAIKAAYYLKGRGLPLDRTTIEVLCSFRPETADALWKLDMEWKYIPEDYKYLPEFIVTTNGAFHRPEVNRYMDELDAYVPKLSKVVLVPCAADKPYPAKLHKAILEFLPPDWYLCICTGVLGLVPSDLWPAAPHYDSGVPNRWRVYEVVSYYFKAYPHKEIVVYSDFYNEAIYLGLQEANALEHTTFVIEKRFYANYVNLLAPDFLAALKKAILKC